MIKHSEIKALRSVIQGLVPLLASKGLVVTQQGTNAFAEYDKNGNPIRVNIPHLPDDASEGLVIAIHGFIDHEVAHVLFTDDKFPGKAETKANKAIAGYVQITEDCRIEKAMGIRFPGSKENLTKLHGFFVEKLTGPALKEAAGDPDREYGVLIVTAMRALAGQPAFQEFMDENKHWEQPRIKELMGKLTPGFATRLQAMGSTQDAFLIAKEIEAAWAKKPPASPEPKAPPMPQPPAPPEPPKDEEPDDEKSDSSTGEGDNTDKPEDEDDKGTDGDKASEPEKDEAEPEEKDEEEGQSKESEPDEADASEGDDKEKDAGEEDGDKPGEEAGEEPADGDKPDEDVEQPENGGDDSADAGDDEADDGSAGDDEQDEDGEASEGSTGEIGDTGDDDGSADEADSEGEESGDGPKQHGVGSTIGQPPPPPPGEDPFGQAIGAAIQLEAGREIARAPYKLFTRDYDQIEPYKRELTAAEFARFDDATRAMIAPMQKDLERMIAAKQLKMNIPGYRSGRLHQSGLHKLAINDDRVFRRRFEQTSKATAVSLLIDGSGSMSGSKCKTSMSAAYAIGQTLERIGVPCEILGFSTGSFPGKVYAEIKAAEEAMGAEYTHYSPMTMKIFKDFKERMTPAVKQSMAYMAKNQEGMASNADADAVQTAGERLLRRQEVRKILIVFSDGQPAATVSRSGRLAFDAQLKIQVQNLLKQGVETLGVGIEDDSVRRYYPKHVVLNDVVDLPGTIIREMKALLMK